MYANALFGMEKYMYVYNQIIENLLFSIIYMLVVYLLHMLRAIIGGPVAETCVLPVHGSNLQRTLSELLRLLDRLSLGIVENALR